MKKPLIFSVTENGENAPIYSQGDYDVFVGALEEKDLPMYVVINRDTKVVEFTHSVTAGYKDFLSQVAPIQAQQELPLSLAMSNRNN